MAIVLKLVLYSTSINLGDSKVAHLKKGIVKLDAAKAKISPILVPIKNKAQSPMSWNVGRKLVEFPFTVLSGENVWCSHVEKLKSHLCTETFISELNIKATWNNILLWETGLQACNFEWDRNLKGKRIHALIWLTAAHPEISTYMNAPYSTSKWDLL